MDDIDTPTAEGQRRYPSEGGWYVIPPGVFVLAVGEPDRYPCTCTRGCPLPCRGDCGCEACRWALEDFRMVGEAYMEDDL